jgi:hypothetical protein
VEALKFLLFYSTRLNPDEERAEALQREIEARDPEGRFAGPAFRERFFRGRSSSPRQEAPR